MKCSCCDAEIEDEESGGEKSPDSEAHVYCEECLLIFDIYLLFS